MITTGVIRQININGGRYVANKYIVELNIFQIPGDLNRKNYTYEANCNVIPGQYASYDIGDKVYVGFINNDLSYPIILGKIYQGVEDVSRSFINCKNLKVTEDAMLPKNTTIGEITYQQLLNLFKRQSQINYRHILLCSTNGQNDERVKLIITSRFNAKYETENLPILYKNLFNMYQDTPILAGIYDTDDNYLYESTVRINMKTSKIEVNIKEEVSTYNEELNITEVSSSIARREVLGIIDDYVVEM